MARRAKTYQQLWDDITSDQEAGQYDASVLIDNDNEFDELLEEVFDPFDETDSKVDDSMCESKSPYEAEDSYDPVDYKPSTDGSVFDDCVHIIPEVSAKRVISTIRSCLMYDMEHDFNSSDEEEIDVYEPVEYNGSNVKFAETVTMVVLSDSSPRTSPTPKQDIKPLKSCLKASANIKQNCDRNSTLKRSRTTTSIGFFDYLESQKRRKSDETAAEEHLKSQFSDGYNPFQPLNHQVVPFAQGSLALGSQLL